MNKLKHQLLRGGVWGALGRLMSAALGIAVSLLVARLIPPHEMGIYFLAASAASLLAVFSSFGLPVTAMRFIASREAVSDRAGSIKIAVSSLIYGAATALVTAGTFAAGLGQGLAVYVFQSTVLESLTIAIAGWGFLLVCQNLITEVCRGFHRIDLATLSGGLLPGAFLTGALLAGVHGGIRIDLDRILILSLLAVALSGLTAIPLARYVLPGSSSLGLISIASFIPTACPIWLHGLAVFGLIHGGIWIIGAFATSEEVAIYGAASRLASVFALVNGMAYAFLPPIIVELNSRGDRGTLQRIVGIAAAIAGVVTLPALCLCLLFPEKLLALMFGDYYTPGALVLMALSFANFFNLVTGVRGYVLLVCGHERLQLGIALIGGAANLIMVYLGLINWGISAAAIGSCIGIVLQCILEMGAVRMRFGIWTIAWCSRADFLKLLASARSTPH